MQPVTQEDRETVAFLGADLILWFGAFVTFGFGVLLSANCSITGHGSGHCFQDFTAWPLVVWPILFWTLTVHAIVGSILVWSSRRRSWVWTVPAAWFVVFIGIAVGGGP